MIRILFGLLAIIVVWASVPSPAVSATRDDVLAIAQRGWVYDLRSAMFRRDPKRPPISINPRDMARSAICLIGDPPHPLAQEVLDSFAAILSQSFGTRPEMRYAGRQIEQCGREPAIYLRLYAGVSPILSLNRDMRWIDELYQIGLGRFDTHLINSPAQAQTFFGRQGRATHILVKEPNGDRTPTGLETRFYKSILIEELFQAFTFGMDILHFDGAAPYLSKLEEYPLNLRNFDWESAAFMEGLLRSSSAGLCEFDVFMLHGLAQSGLEQTNTAELIASLDRGYDALLSQARSTLARPEIQTLLDPACAKMPE